MWHGHANDCEYSYWYRSLAFECNKAKLVQVVFPLDAGEHDIHD